MRWMSNVAVSVPVGPPPTTTMPASLREFDGVAVIALAIASVSLVVGEERARKEKLVFRVRRDCETMSDGTNVSITVGECVLVKCIADAFAQWPS